MEFIPSILEEDLRRTQRLIATFGMLPDVHTLQLDIMDGIFVPRKTDFSAEEFLDVSSIANIEVHLMVQHPQESLADWLAHPSVVRILVHYEVIAENFVEVVRQVHEARKEIGVVLNPETSVDSLNSSVAEADVIMCMGVHPGKQGQDFLPGTLEKFRALQKEYPSMPLEVDGGVGIENIVLLRDAGCTRAVLGSFLKEGTSPEDQLKKIRDKV